MWKHVETSGNDLLSKWKHLTTTLWKQDSPPTLLTVSFLISCYLYLLMKTLCTPLTRHMTWRLLEKHGNQLSDQNNNGVEKHS